MRGNLGPLGVGRAAESERQDHLARVARGIGHPYPPAIRQAEAEGSGVASLNGKMVDAPIVNRAERIIALARLLGLCKEGK